MPKDTQGLTPGWCILRSKRSDQAQLLNGGVWLEEVLRVALPSLKFSGVAVRCLAAAVPALVLVLFAGLIALIALFMGEEKRAYVLDLTVNLTELARVLMGPPLAPEAPTDPAAIEVGATEVKKPKVAPPP